MRRGTDRTLLAFRAGAAIAFLAVASLPLRPAAGLPGRPLTEDAFYVLTIARHIAAGHGITIDGITPTNGFQPLYTFAVAALAWIASGDRLVLMRLVLAFSLALHVVAALALGAIAAGFSPDEESRARFRWATVLCYLGLRLLVVQHFNGLETGLVLALISVTWLAYMRTGARTNRAGLALGVLLGTLVVARIDMVFLVATVAAATWWPRERHRPSGVVRAAVVVVPLVMLSPWLAYSYSVSGTIVPTSGLAQQEWTLSWSRIWSAVVALAQDGVPVYLGALESNGVSLVRVGLFAAGSIWAGTLVRREWGKQGDTSRDRLVFGLALLAAVVALAGWYAVSSWAAHFYFRYFAPLLVLSCAGVGIALGAAAGRRPLLTRIVAVALALQAVAYAGAVHTAFYAGRHVPGRAAWARPIFMDQVQLVSAHVPPSELVAAGQSGTLGFLRDGVVNVDGKVNRDALFHQHDMIRYLDGRGIRWFCDMPQYVTKYLGEDPPAAGWRLVSSAGLFDLYVHRPPDAGTRPTSCP